MLEILRKYADYLMTRLMGFHSFIKTEVLHAGFLIPTMLENASCTIDTQIHSSICKCEGKMIRDTCSLFLSLMTIIMYLFHKISFM